jgi:hypothetical protein
VVPVCAPVGLDVSPLSAQLMALAAAAPEMMAMTSTGLIRM